MPKITSFYFRLRIIIPVIVLAIGAGWYFFFRGNGAEYEVVSAKIMDLRQEVSVTGRVEPIQSVELSFEKGGRVRSVTVKVGDRVLPGAVLMSLENADLYANRDQASADLKAQQALLDEYRRGTRPEELAVYEAKVASAHSTVIDASSNLIDKIADSYTKSDDAVRNKVDQFFIGPRGSNPQLSFSLSDSALESKIEQGRFSIEGILMLWNASLTSIEADIPGALVTAKDNASRIRAFLDDVALGLSTLSPSGILSQTTIDGYRTDISTARTNINTAIANLTAAEEKLRTAQAARTVAERELALAKAGKTAEEIAAQEARVLQAEAKVRSADAEIVKTLIRAPIDGIVTEKNIDPGETVSSNVVMVKLLSASGFKIEAFVPEVDIAKVKEGDSASITLDAYGSDMRFAVIVSRIDPRETIIDGVATYKVTFGFVEKDDRIRAGMTANIDIRTNERTGVLAVPQRAVRTDGGKKYVDLLDADGKTRISIEVETGLKGSDGNIEIISGLSEGQSVIVFSEE